MKDKMPIDADTPGSRIKYIRKLLEIKQVDFARSLDLSVTSLSDYETGKKNPSFEFILNIATKYNASVEYIVLGNGNPFMLKGAEFDDFFKDLPFGSFTDDVKEMIWYMRHSQWALSACVNHFKEFLSKNLKSVEKEIKAKKLTRKKGEGKK